MSPAGQQILKLIYHFLHFTERHILQYGSGGDNIFLWVSFQPPLDATHKSVDEIYDLKKPYQPQFQISKRMS